MKIKNLLTFIVLLLIAQNAIAQDETTLAKEGAPAPDFTFEVKDGVTKKLSDLKGKVIWINFFANWCPPCRKELPHLEKEVYKKYKNNADFELLIFGREHDWATVNKFKADNNYIMPFYPDVERKIFAKYAKQNIPRNFVIDKDGKVVVASTGFNEEEFKEIIQKVKELLK